MEDSEKDKKAERKIVRKHAEEDREKRTRRSNNMPSQYEGKGPQENTAVGYDPLQDI